MTTMLWRLSTYGNRPYRNIHPLGVLPQQLHTVDSYSKVLGSNLGLDTGYPNWTSYSNSKDKKKGKAIPVTGRGGL
jgi:hypothetical protein